MKYSKQFAPGTSHPVLKGMLHIRSYYEIEETLMVKYTMDDDQIIHNIKYLNMISNIYRHRKALQTGTVRSTLENSSSRQLLEAELVRSLKFGVELEVISPVRSTVILEKMRAVGIDMEAPTRAHETVTGWKLVRDGSIITSDSCPFGFEIVSPPQTDFKDLEKVCKILKENKIKTNFSTGLHVHHEIKELKRQQIIRVYEFYNKYESAIDSMLPERRKNNRFCKPIKEVIETVRSSSTKSSLLKKVAGAGNSMYYDGCRYYKINLRSFIYYGTIEFRQHHGSIDFEEISNWILFTHKIIDRATQINRNIKPLENERISNNAKITEMVKELKIENTKLEKNLKTRFEKYGLLGSSLANSLANAC